MVSFFFPIAIYCITVNQLSWATRWGATLAQSSSETCSREWMTETERVRKRDKMEAKEQWKEYETVPFNWHLIEKNQSWRKSSNLPLTSSSRAFGILGILMKAFCCFAFNYCIDCWADNNNCNGTFRCFEIWIGCNCFYGWKFLDAQFYSSKSIKR